jgi:hypothetical protein
MLAFHLPTTVDKEPYETMEELDRQYDDTFKKELQ